MGQSEAGRITQRATEPFEITLTLGSLPPKDAMQVGIFSNPSTGVSVHLRPSLVRPIASKRLALHRQVKDMTAGDVTAVQPVLLEVPTVVLSSQDVYQAYTGLRTNRFESPVPLTADSEPRRDRYPYRGSGLEGVPDDYEKLDVEERWLARGAVVLRLPMVYGPHDQQRREDLVLRRIRGGRQRMPIGAGNLL